MSDPCESCGGPAAPDCLRCDNCWEVERRLDSYLQSGRPCARQFVIAALRKAMSSSESEWHPAFKAAGKRMERPYVFRILITSDRLAALNDFERVNGMELSIADGESHEDP